MSKQSTNIARICASLILGFTQVSFAASTDPTLMEIPPPPILRGPAANSQGQAQTNTTTYNTGNNSAAAAVGTSKGGMSNNAPSVAVPQVASSNPGLFAKSNNGVSATSTQSDNANAVNAAALEAQKAAMVSATPTGVQWGTQIFPAANTMYSTPQRK